MGTWGGGWESSFSIVSDSQSRKAKMEIDFIIVQENSQEASVPARRRPHRDRARRQPAALSADQAGRPRPRRSPSPYSASKSWLRPPRPSTTFSVAARPRVPTLVLSLVHQRAASAWAGGRREKPVCLCCQTSTRASPGGAKPQQKKKNKDFLAGKSGGKQDQILEAVWSTKEAEARVHRRAAPEQREVEHREERARWRREAQF